MPSAACEDPVFSRIVATGGSRPYVFSSFGSPAAIDFICSVVTRPTRPSTAL
jgi:hypothetical protein